MTAAAGPGATPGTAHRGPALAWVLLTHTTIIGWTIAYLVSEPRTPVWVAITGVVTSCLAAGCLLRLRPARVAPPRGRTGLRHGVLVTVLTALLAVSPPVMLSIGLSNLYARTVLRPVPATVLSIGLVRTGKYSRSWDATVELTAGEVHRISLGRDRPVVGGRVEAWVDPTGFAAPRGVIARRLDVLGPLAIGLCGLGMGWYRVLGRGTGHPGRR